MLVFRETLAAMDVAEIIRDSGAAGLPNGVLSREVEAATAPVSIGTEAMRCALNIGLAPTAGRGLPLLARAFRSKLLAEATLGSLALPAPTAIGASSKDPRADEACDNVRRIDGAAAGDPALTVAEAVKRVEEIDAARPTDVTAEDTGRLVFLVANGIAETNMLEHLEAVGGDTRRDPLADLVGVTVTDVLGAANVDAAAKCTGMFTDQDVAGAVAGAFAAAGTTDSDRSALFSALARTTGSDTSAALDALSGAADANTMVAFELESLLTLRADAEGDGGGPSFWSCSLSFAVCPRAS